MRPEYARGAAVMATCVLALCAVALLATWFEYDFSSGRKTAPDGPYHMEGNGVIRHSLTIGASGWDGDTEPSDLDKANLAVMIGTAGTAATALLSMLVILGEVPGIHALINRRRSLACIAAAIVVALTAAAATFILLPASMAGHGITSPFTARLDEPDGYTHGQLTYGWYAMALTPLLLGGAALFKFQAGADGLSVVEELAQGGEA